MLRNKVFTALQKTYDDSYLSCSTAVYYESQVRHPSFPFLRVRHKRQPGSAFNQLTKNFSPG